MVRNDILNHPSPEPDRNNHLRKAKGADPGNWGDVNLSEDELDLAVQDQLLNACNIQKALKFVKEGATMEKAFLINLARGGSLPRGAWRVRRRILQVQILIWEVSTYHRSRRRPLPRHAPPKVVQKRPSWSGKLRLLGEPRVIETRSLLGPSARAALNRGRGNCSHSV